MRVLITKNYILYLFILIFLKSAFANESLNQFSVEADKSIEYFEKQRIYVASGNARALKGNLSINAEKITAFIGKTQKTNMTDIEATGNVIIINNNTVAKSDFAKYNFKNKIIILKGKSQSVEAKKFKLESKKYISFDDQNKVANSEGDVKLFLSGPISIFAKKMKANFDKVKNTLITASAYSNVKIQTNLETITCNSAKYDTKTNLISLDGNVVIKKGNNLLSGEKGYMNLKTRKSRIESGKSKRVKGVFKPANN